MHRNYHIFEKQVLFLKEKLLSAIISDCFTHRKDELVLRLSKTQDSFLRIGLSVQFPYLLHYTAFNIKDPKTGFFKDIIGYEIKDIRIIPYDKIVYIDLGDYLLRSVFYGGTRNVYFEDSNKNVISSFKKVKRSANKTTASQNLLALSANQFKNLDWRNIKYSLANFIYNNLGGFNKRLLNELCFRSELNSEKLISDLTEKQWKNLIQHMNVLQEELKQNKVLIYESDSMHSVISLINLKHLSDNYRAVVYSDVNEAWKKFIYLNQQVAQTAHRVKRSREKILNRIGYLKKTLIKLSDFKQLEQKKKLSEIKGNLLLSLASNIPKGKNTITLKNLYAENEEEISISLNPKLSIMENAAVYFNKYKDIGIKKKELRFKRDTVEGELNFWKKIYLDTENIDSLKQAVQLEQILAQKNLSQHKINTTKSRNIDSSDFYRILLDQKWEVLIGKNAQNNDLLTFKFAQRTDIWLHAQGVPGSHVVIRISNKDQMPPLAIIEKAASMAAFYSSAKNSKTVPVNYTQVRYVRKPRKASPGTAILSNEKTIFVEPKKYL